MRAVGLERLAVEGREVGVRTSWYSSSCLVRILSCASSSPAVPEPVYLICAISISAATFTSIR